MTHRVYTPVNMTPMILLGICLLQVAATAAASSALPGSHDTTSDAMVDWIKQYGGQVNVAMRRLDNRGRGTFAPKDMKKGDVLAAIPVELVYAANYTYGGRFEGAGAQLVIDMHDKDSFWQPYFSSLPPVGSVINYAHIPDSYLALLQDANMERATRAHQENVRYYCDLATPNYHVLQLDVNTTHCAHATALLTTRTFSYGGTEALLPVVDMANHDNGCPHTHRVEYCDPVKGQKQRDKGLSAPEVPPSFAKGVNSSLACSKPGGKGKGKGCKKGGKEDGKHDDGVSGVCITWRAEADLKAGEEVCNCYGMLLQDHALLQYGFLQSGPIALELSMLDRPEHSQEYAKTWDKPEAEWGQALPHKFTGAPRTLLGRLQRRVVDVLGLKGGTKDELQAEVVRLQGRLTTLTAANDQLAKIQVDTELDPDGSILDMVQEWRRQRLAAIEFEVQRLQAVLGVTGAKDEL